MFTRIISYTRHGVDAVPVAVEVDVGSGLPAFELVGMAGSATREARERVRAAIRNAGAQFPARRVTVNLAPAGLPKEGTGFDLAIALGILAATGQVPGTRLARLGVVGELSLDGSLRPVRGALAAALQAKAGGCTGVLAPAASAREAALAGIKVIPAGNLTEVMEWLRGRRKLTPARAAHSRTPSPPTVDLADVQGQPVARRAVEIAAAGGHHLLMVGPPGVGKSMFAQALAGILPPLTPAEALEVTAVHSTVGVAIGELIGHPPFRAPHHSASRAAILGGGAPPIPGEISLAHRGVLFLDELPEFGRDVLEALRQPLEEGVVRIARAGWSLSLPAAVQVVAAANPCPCGYLGDNRRPCTCPPGAITRYRERLSGPMLDRFDLQVWLGSLDDAQWGDRSAEPSAAVAARVAEARERQQARLGPYDCYTNSGIRPRDLPAVLDLETEAEVLLRRAVNRLGLSLRGRDRVLRVARTIADLEGTTRVQPLHVAEALQYRLPLPRP